MAQDWQAPLRLVRDQFVDASREAPQPELLLTSFSSLDALRVWRKPALVGVEGAARAGQIRFDFQSGTVWGEAAGVERFTDLATAAAHCFPETFRPGFRLFPPVENALNQRPDHTTLWLEFLFVTRRDLFRPVPDYPERGCQIFQMTSDPFLASATAIEEYLLSPVPLSAERYVRMIREACLWLTNLAGGCPLPGTAR